MKTLVLLLLTAIGILLLPSRVSWARDCGRTSHGHYATSGGHGELSEKPTNAQPWVELTEEEANRVADEMPSCIISDVDGGVEIPASIDVAPANPETSRVGCTTVGIFGSMIA